MDPMMLIAMLMAQNGGGAPGAGNSGVPGQSPAGTDLGALFRQPPGMAPQTSSAVAPEVAPGAGTTGNFPGPIPGISVGSAPPGLDTSTQSPGTTQGPPPGVSMPAGPSTAAAAGSAMPGLGNLAGLKMPAAPNPVMSGGTHAGNVPMAGVHHAGAPAIAALLNAILGARGTPPLGTPAIGASLRSGV
jgi:hypothetical protein